MKDPPDELRLGELAPYWLAAIVESAEDAIITKTLDGVITSWNKGAERIFGYSAEEAVGRPVTMLIPADHPDEEPAILTRLRAGERIEHYETVRVRKDGSLVDISLTVSPIRGPHGKIIGASKIARDTSERKRAEVSLRQREEELTDFIENSAVGLHWVGPDGTILWANKAELDLLGYARDEYIGHHIAEFHADPAVIEDILGRLTGDETLHSYEARLRCKDGSIRHVLISSNVLRRDGEFVHTRCFTRDITERRQAEESLRLYGRVLDCMVEGVSVSDERGFIIYTNPAEDEMFGYERGELVGRHVTVLNAYPPEENERIVGEVIEQLKTSGVWTGEWSNRRKDGTPFTTFARITALEISGRKHWVCVQEDVTERKRDAAELQATEHRFRMFMENLPGLAWIKDLEGRYVYVNDAATRAFGVERAELYGRTDEQVFPPDTAAQFRENDRRALEDGAGVQAIEVLEQADGPHYSLVSKFPLLDPEGGRVLVGGVAVDVTEQQRAEAALRSSEARLRALFAAMTDVVLVLGGDGRYLEIAPTNPRLLYKPPAELIGRTLHEVLPADQADFFLGHVRRALETREPHAVEYKLRIGTEDIWFEASVSPMTENAVFWIARDVTGHKRAEEELRDSRRQLEELLKREQAARAEAERQRDFTRLVLEDAPLAIGVMEGPDHRFVLVNRQTCDLTGLSEEQFIGRTHAEVVPAADKVVSPILDRVYATGLSETQEVDIELPNGRRQLLVTWTALPGGDGRAASILYLSLDITGRKSAEEALRASEEQFRAVAETAPDAIITIDEESTILFANRSTGKIFGYAWEELSGRPLTTLMPEYLRHLHQAGVRRFVETGQRHISWEAVELPGLHKGGHEVPLEISFSEFVTNGKRHFTGIVRDITERKRSQEALRESERRLRILADAVPQLVWMAEPDGHIFWYNQRWYDYTGATPEQMEGWGWQSVHDAEMLPRVVERWKASLETGEPFEMEFPLKGADGAFRWFLTRVNPLRDSHGRIVRWFGTNTDVDGQRRTAEELREANRLKDEFLATVSHELRTPLTAILGWSHLLRTTGQFGGDEASLKALETIERNARSQSQLIDDLLDVSRIITGKLRIDIRPVDPNSFIEAAVEAVRPAAEAKGVRVQRIMDTGVVTVSGDPARLQQVVWNLLSNAIKFTPRGGRVQIRLERVNSHVEIAVSDTGAGIAEEFLPYVFDRFRQADQRTTRLHGGLGLGLAIVRHLVELHGGTVRAESAGEGQGATFTVLLPVAPIYQSVGGERRVHPAARDTLPSYECPDTLDGLRVLAVDDEPDTRELLTAGLGRCGALVTAVGSAAEALEAIASDVPDLLISDIGMPEEDGYELIRRVRDLPAERGGKVPAIALTAYARVEDRMQALRAGYEMHVTKPVELAELVAVAASLVRRAR